MYIVYRQFRKHARPREGFIPFQNKVYSPYDPKLTISGVPFRSLYPHTMEQKHGKPIHTSFSDSHFKFLGRLICPDLWDKCTKLNLSKKYWSLIKLIDSAPVNGFAKLWIYQFGLLSQLNWPFMIYDFNISLTKSWDRRTGVYLKKWARIFRNADVGILYRSRTMFGLQLTPPSSHFKKMQLIKSHILKHSSDPSIRALYNARSSRESSFRHKNRGSHFLSHVEPVVNHNLQFPSQRDRQGLGHGRHNKPHNNKEHRALLVAASLREESDKLYAHSITLVLQGVWTHWIDYVEPFDMSWNTIIYHIQPKLLSFMLNAMINSLPTPDLLRMWNIRGDAVCYLCHRSPCTLHHILVNCYPALKGKRYNWRHDSVLSTLHPMLTNQINSFNSSSSSSNPIQLPIHFIQAGNTSTKGIRSQRSSLLMDATDWKLLVDYDRDPIIFPPEIIPTNERPDIIIWSLTSKRVILFELTCGAE